MLMSSVYRRNHRSSARRHQRWVSWKRPWVRNAVSQHASAHGQVIGSAESPVRPARSAMCKYRAAAVLQTATSRASIMSVTASFTAHPLLPHARAEPWRGVPLRKGRRQYGGSGTTAGMQFPGSSRRSSGRWRKNQRRVRMHSVSCSLTRDEPPCDRRGRGSAITRWRLQRAERTAAGATISVPVSRRAG